MEIYESIPRSGKVECLAQPWGVSLAHPKNRRKENRVRRYLSGEMQVERSRVRYVGSVSARVGLVGIKQALQG